MEPSEQQGAPAEDPTEIPDTVEPQEEEVDEAQTPTVLTTQTVPVLSQEDIEKLPRLEAETVSVAAVERLEEVADRYGVLEKACSLHKPGATLPDAILAGIDAQSAEVTLTQDLIAEDLGSEMTEEQALAFVNFNLASEIPGAGPCSFLAIAVRAYQNGVEGLPPMDQFYGPLYRAHGIGFYGEQAENLLKPVKTCVMKVSQSVTVRAWPEVDSFEVGRIRADDNLQIYGKIQLPGEKTYYILHGQLVTKEGFIGIGRETRHPGLKFVAASHVDVIGNCGDLIDLSPVGHLLEPVPPLRVGNPAFIFNLPARACTFSLEPRQTTNMCPEIWSDVNDCKEVENDYVPGALNTSSCRFDITKMTNDGWLYAEWRAGGACGQINRWIPPVDRNRATSTVERIDYIVYEETDFPDVSECLSKYYEE